MATTFGQNVLQPQKTIRTAGLIGAAAAMLVTASAVTLAIVSTDSTSSTSSVAASTIAVERAEGRGLVAGTGSYAEAAVVAQALRPVDDYFFRHQALAMKLGPADDYFFRHMAPAQALGEQDDWALRHRPSAAVQSQPRGGLTESAEVR